MNDLNALLEFLRNGITDKMPLEQILNVFEQMCKIPISEASRGYDFI